MGLLRLEQLEKERTEGYVVIAIEDAQVAEANREPEVETRRSH